MVKITAVLPSSLAERAGIRAGDTLLKINGEEINDVLDYRFYLTEIKIDVEVLSGDEVHTVTISKDEYDDIGLEFETPLMDKKHSCKNGCIFCFIDQNPKGMRESIYFKDDDSRLSFIHGNYITLTNMTKKDVDRIIKMRISPINISIHTTNPELRVKMMKNKRSGEVLSYLDDFKAAGLTMCGQIVLCRGVNDKDELARSLTDLSQYYPAMSSVAIVPAGLTKHRDGLYPLSDFTADEALEVINTVDRFGTMMREKYGTRVFYASDEFYLKAGLSIPSADYYEDYPQLDNGVGMLRSFADEFTQAKEDYTDFTLKSKRKFTIACGTASEPMLSNFAMQLMKMNSNVEIVVKPILNNYFGHSITVSGLMTGKDIFEQLEGEDIGTLLLPLNCLKADEDVFLCGMTTDELSKKLGCKIKMVDTDGFSFVDTIFADE